MNWIQGISADMITSSKAYAHRIAQLSSCFAYYIHLLFTASSAYNKQFYVCAVLFENIPILYDLFTLVWTNNRFHQADWKFICFLEWKKKSFMFGCGEIHSRSTDCSMSSADFGVSTLRICPDSWCRMFMVSGSAKNLQILYSCRNIICMRFVKWAIICSFKRSHFHSAACLRK